MNNAATICFIGMLLVASCAEESVKPPSASASPKNSSALPLATAENENNASLQKAVRPRRVSVNLLQACAVSRSGAVWCMGSNYRCQLQRTDIPGTLDEFTKISAPRDIVSVAAGGSLTCAVDKDGALYCWGGYAGRLLSWGDDPVCEDACCCPVSYPGFDPIVDIQGGPGSICFMSAIGELRCFDIVQIGTSQVQYDAREAVMGRDVAAYDAGSNNGCAVSRDREMNCWRYTGNGGYFNYRVEKIAFTVSNIDRTAGGTVQDVAVSPFGGCLLVDDHLVSCWGRRQQAHPIELDEDEVDGNTEKYLTFDNVETLHPLVFDSKIVKVAVSAIGNCALDEHGRVACWGYTRKKRPKGRRLKNGRIAFLDNAKRIWLSRPVYINGIENAVDLSVGHYNCAVTSDDTVLCWIHDETGEMVWKKSQRMDE